MTGVVEGKSSGASMRIVLASHNAGKLAELGLLLAPLGVALVAQPTLGVGPADEPHGTFVENALAKARHASAASGCAALADDSGLCVDALGGAPGVLSARYAGSDVGGRSADLANMQALLTALARTPPDERAARFVCALVAVRAPDDPEPLIAVGRWHGTIAVEARGASGFGYDPIFVPAANDRTAAELSPDEKNRMSHRAVAVAQLQILIREVWGLGGPPA